MTGARNRLYALLQELRSEWDQTRSFWTDAKAVEFEQQYLNELTRQVHQAIAALETLEQILQQMRRDCE
ncbi:MAG: hypothetical protein RMN51_06620 [Verrucomicrobiota bacterium]|nr:hypothetical protein [Limisphaera sp.]MDW8381764.1 hypothetical protein [Verrucomicrobiota bacterium]